MKKRLFLNTGVLVLLLSLQAGAQEAELFETPDHLNCQLTQVNHESHRSTVLENIQIVRAEELRFVALPGGEPLVLQNSDENLLTLVGFRSRYEVSSVENGFRVVHTERRGVGSIYGEFDMISDYACN